MKTSVSWEFYDDKSFSGKKNKNNKDYASIILNATRIIKSTTPLNENQLTKKWIKHLKLDISKISRLFIYLDKCKYFSCYFPFFISESGKSFIIRNKDVEITDQLLSEMFSLLNDIEKCSLFNKFQDEDEETNYSIEAYQILEELITTEPGYIRYDMDFDNANGHIHPKIHFDVNMSKKSTFKIGIFEEMTESTFESIFNKKQDCFYLIHPSKFKYSHRLKKKQKK